MICHLYMKQMTNTEKIKTNKMVQTDTVVLQAYCEEVTFLCSALSFGIETPKQWDIL